jgi:hypothetical protein
MGCKSSVVYQDQPDGAATRVYSRVEQGTGEIRRAECVISQLAQLGPEQGSVPLVGEDEQNTRLGRRC